MDLEAGIYSEDPAFEAVLDRLSSSLFQVNSNNGKISESLRLRASSTPSANAVNHTHKYVEENQLLFRQLKPEIEALELWKEPTPAQRYSQHKVASDFAKLFHEFKQLQEAVISSARELPFTEPEDDGHEIEMDYRDEMMPPLYEQESLTFDEQLRQDEVSYQQGLIAEREEEIEHMAQGMNELNAIFESLGEIVRGQGVTLDNIESNMYNVASQIRGGSQQLVKAHRYQRASTGRMCCFLIILLTLLLVVVVAVSF